MSTTYVRTTVIPVVIARLPSVLALDFFLFLKDGHDGTEKRHRSIQMSKRRDVYILCVPLLFLLISIFIKG